MSSYATDLIKIREARERIRGHSHLTPVHTSSSLDRLAGCQLFFKCENFQKGGAFKFRGACNAILKLSEKDLSGGVATHSSGNHGQAVALAASLRKVAAHIVIPKNASQLKRLAVEAYGGRIYECDSTLEARERKVAEVQSKTGAVLVPPYNHPDIIAGQGTVALELLEQVPQLDAIVAPVGGGGLISGITIAAKGLISSIRIFGVEPKGADDAARSKDAGKLLPQTAPRTIADGLRTSLGDLTWRIIRDPVEQFFTVSEEEIVSAMRLVWERMKLVIEPSAAVAVAGVMTQEFRKLSGLNRVGVVLSGGNVDLDNLPW